jgi:uncharacterized Zn finger protein
MSYMAWGPYVSVAEKRRKAEREVKKLQKKGQSIEPVVIEGKKIAASFWGKAWCDNLERYSDYANRLPRGRSYVRNGSVVDLKLTKGEVLAFVSGSSLYTVRITIEPTAKARWKSICRDCTGSIDSLVELLQGRMAKSVMDRVCRAGDGLFPAPKEIKLSCSCPDWADMCKHVAATLYGVGARLDKNPQLLFALRGVDESELLADAASGATLSEPGSSKAKMLDDGDVAALFGLEMADGTDAAPPAPAVKKNGRKPRQASADKLASVDQAVPKTKARNGKSSKSKSVTAGAAQKPAAQKLAANKVAAKRRAAKRAARPVQRAA